MSLYSMGRFHPYPVPTPAQNEHEIVYQEKNPTLKHKISNTDVT